IARTLRDVWRAIQAGDASGGELAWFLGILISATGAAAIAGGIGLFVVARGAGRAESELQPRAESGELDQPGSAHECPGRRALRIRRRGCPSREPAARRLLVDVLTTSCTHLMMSTSGRAVTRVCRADLHARSMTIWRRRG